VWRDGRGGGEREIERRKKVGANEGGREKRLKIYIWPEKRGEQTGIKSETGVLH